MKEVNVLFCHHHNKDFGNTDTKIMTSSDSSSAAIGIKSAVLAYRFINNARKKSIENAERELMKKNPRC